MLCVAQTLYFWVLVRVVCADVLMRMDEHGQRGSFFYKFKKSKNKRESVRILT